MPRSLPGMSTTRLARPPRCWPKRRVTNAIRRHRWASSLGSAPGGPRHRPNLAPPGLSPHGQALAFDFQVLANSATVAPTDSRRIQADWLDAGWAQRLAHAMTEAGPAFKGPLLSPNEPWH